MPCRRYFIALAPVAHINGKMAPVAVKCSNTEDPEHTHARGFWYGYKRQAAPNVSRFGIRTICRDLTAHPYTPAEDENRTIFTASLHAVYEHKMIAADWALMLADFSRQTQYATPLGYAVAGVRSNGGVWLEEWTH